MRILLFLIGAALTAAGIGIGNHALVATVGSEVATCGSGFTAGPPLNVGFSSVEIRDSLRALCAEKNSAWKLYAWTAIGLGAAVMVGSAFMGANRAPGPTSTSSPRPSGSPSRYSRPQLFGAITVIGLGIAAAFLAGRLLGAQDQDGALDPAAGASAASSAAATGTTPSAVTTAATTTTATTSTELSSAAMPTSATSRMTAAPLTVLTADVTGRRYVPVTTVSGWPRCQIWEESVTCEFSKMIVGKGNGITVRADGSSGWATGNMGRETFQSLDYATTYTALGWTVRQTEEGTRFTNESTGHGMLVTTQNAFPF